jgi:DNA polymerase-3 subunit alpha
MRLITAERAAGGPFAGLLDFAARVDLRRIGKKALEMLARAGALDALDSNRRKVFESLETLIAWSATVHDERGSAQVSLFGETTATLPAPRLPSPEDWAAVDRLGAEHQAVGFYLSGHPLDAYEGVLRRLGVPTHAELQHKAATMPVAAARIAGTVAGRDERKSANGRRFAFVRLSDPTGLFEVVMYSEVLDAARAHLEPGQSVVLTVEASREGEELRLRAKGVVPIDDAVAGAAGAGLRLYVNDSACAVSLAVRLQRAREGLRRGTGPVHLVVNEPGLEEEVEIALPGTYTITPQIAAALKDAAGVVHVEEF